MFKLFKLLFFLATLNCRTLNKNDVIISINICHFFVAARFSCLSFIFFQHFFIVYISKKMHACEFIQFIYFQLLFNICIYLFWKSIYFSFRKVIFLIDSINLSYCANAEKSNILHAAAAATRSDARAPSTATSGELTTEHRIHCFPIILVNIKCIVVYWRLKLIFKNDFCLIKNKNLFCIYLYCDQKKFLFGLKQKLFIRKYPLLAAGHPPTRYTSPPFKCFYSAVGSAQTDCF